MADDDVLSKLRSMRLSLWWYQSSLKDLESELRGVYPPYKVRGVSARTIIRRRKNVWFYTRLMLQECRATISLLDHTFKAVSEVSCLIGSRLRLTQEEVDREPFQATYIANEASLPEALRTAGKRINNPIMKLRSYIDSLRSAVSYPSATNKTDTAIQEALREVDDHYKAIAMKCDMLSFLFKFKARQFIRLVRERSTQRDRVLLKGRRY